MVRSSFKNVFAEKLIDRWIAAFFGASVAFRILAKSGEHGFDVVLMFIQVLKSLFSIFKKADLGSFRGWL